jgi:Acetyl/propionyl-CoA carboxylase, alpha subunit
MESRDQSGSRSISSGGPPRHDIRGHRAHRSHAGHRHPRQNQGWRSGEKGDVVVVLEAMKMELPLRALGDGIVSAVRCREGDLVQADATLVEFA